jgi:hypothetical protein
MSILGSVHNRGGNGTGGVYSLAGDGTESVERGEGSRINPQTVDVFPSSMLILVVGNLRRSPQPT